MHLLGLGSGWILATSLITACRMCEVRQFAQGGSALTHCSFKPVTLNIKVLMCDKKPLRQSEATIKREMGPHYQSSYSASGDHMASGLVSRHSCGSDSHHIIAQPSSRCTFLSCASSVQDFLDKEINPILQRLQSPLRFFPLWIIGCFWMSPCCVMMVVLHVSFKAIRARNLVIISPLQRETEVDGVKLWCKG